MYFVLPFLPGPIAEYQPFSSISPFYHGHHYRAAPGNRSRVVQVGSHRRSRCKLWNSSAFPLRSAGSVSSRQGMCCDKERGHESPELLAKSSLVPDLQVPYLTESTVDHIPNNSLVRFRGMVSSRVCDLGFKLFRSTVLKEPNMRVSCHQLPLVLVATLRAGSRHGQP
jgi:hypothetical protein